MREIKFRIWKDYMPGFEYFSLEDVMFSREDDLTRINQSSPSDYEQYTGLKDKNGKDIYEGDVIYLAGFGDLTVEDCGFDLWDAIKSGNADDIGSIIGNIHEDKP